MDFVFLDANVLFSAAYRVDSRLRRLWQLPRVQLLTSSFAAEEARRNLAIPGQRSELDELMKSVRMVALYGSLDHPIFSTIMLADKDRPILLAAITARATHLLTGDLQHFGPYFRQRIEGVLIVPPAEYLRAVSTGEEP